MVEKTIEKGVKTPKTVYSSNTQEHIQKYEYVLRKNGQDIKVITMLKNGVEILEDGWVIK